jgi:hypothetical protein
VALWYRPSDIEGYWSVGDLLHGEGPLAPGDSFRVEIEPGSYDLRADGELGARYTRYDIDITEEGYTWEVSPEDKEE